ncbi:MAG: polysaccharide deacetylase family protein [Armatimonadota bacterium]
MEPRDYITQQLSLIVGAKVDVTDAQVDRFWEMLSRREEYHGPVDRHGNYDHTVSALMLQEQFEHPPLHGDIAALAASAAGVLPRWPNGHRFAACLTHDVDRIVTCPWRERQRQCELMRGHASPLQLLRWHTGSLLYGLRSLAGTNDRNTYDFWLEEEGRRGFHSTFFVLPEQLEHPNVHDLFYRYDDMIVMNGTRVTFAEASRRMVGLGWEIGLHGSYNSAYDARILRAEKKQVEAMIGQPVTSIRQHYLRFHIDVTPRVHHHAGFQVDSTLGYSKIIGCRAGLAFPFFWPEMDLLQIPLIIQDVGLLRNRPHGKLQQATARAEALIRRIAEVGGVVTLGWHTHPESPGAYACYRALLDLISDLNGWGCSAGELNAWWRQRRAALYPDMMRMVS